ncbi:hypothetical protein FEF65_12800 [Mariprofundus erugo]|uniref:Uncharacterized protein n=1 Tax=Mariprofundus erugo TaxID=2528639 RepID=A0A5R9GGJ3_9PROT|nr:hypothetical protein [Mariprofundus erugo]TLS65560.1 hypothetical protein FEF65_12800 [Mariprofundus erugo]
MSEDANNTTEKSSGSSCAGSSCCSPHTTLLVAVMALLLAGYATFAATSKSGNSAVEARLSQLENQAMETSGRIDTLNKEVASNRDSLVQTKLKKALQDIQEAGDLAGSSTKEAIADAAKILLSLTSPAEPAVTPATSEAKPVTHEPPVNEPDATAAPAAPELPANSATPDENTPNAAPAAEPAAEPATHQSL